MRPTSYVMLMISGLCWSINIFAAPTGGFHIIESFARAYQTGDYLSAADIVNLRSGEKLRVKSLNNQEKCDVVGPYASPLRCAGMMFVAERARPRQRSASTLPPSAWALDIQRSSDFCYRNPEELQLWRSDADKAVRLEIKSYINNAQIRLRWPAQQTLLNWPMNKLPLAEDSMYMFKVHDSTMAVNFHKIPAHLSDAEQLDWMQEQGCSAQLSILQQQTALLAN